MPQFTTALDCGECGGCDKPLAQCVWCGSYSDEHDAHGRTATDDCPAMLDGDPQWSPCETGYVETFKGDRMSPPEGEPVCERCAPGEPDDNDDREDDNLRRAARSDEALNYSTKTVMEN